MLSGCVVRLGGCVVKRCVLVAAHVHADVHTMLCDFSDVSLAALVAM